jgi:hypothetical protein
MTMYLYKGAGPGTHWFINDPRTAGGFLVAPVPSGPSAVIRHIVNYSWPSAYTSFSASFAAACEYALNGPAGTASAANPGYVYEIDVPLALEAGVRFVDPAQVILGANPPVGVAGLVPTHHDGGADLIRGIADPLQAAILTTSPRRPTNPAIPAGPSARAGGPPVVHPHLRAVIFALRDSEVLASTNVGAGCITQRYLVY